MGEGLSVEGVSSALLFFCLIFGCGAVLWPDVKLRAYILLLWLFNVADIIPQAVVSSANGYVPEYWTVTYMIAAMAFIWLHRRHKHGLHLYTGYAYAVMVFFALFALLAKSAPNPANGEVLARMGLTGIHIAHWAIGLMVGWTALERILMKWAEE